jgi:hypothetical protein
MPTGQKNSAWLETRGLELFYGRIPVALQRFAITSFLYILTALMGHRTAATTVLP